MIYIDMDGVLAKWDTNISYEETFLPGYFLTRELDESAAEMVRNLLKNGKDITILSAVYTNGIAAPEKERWLAEHGMGDLPFIFVPYGEDKNKYVEAGESNVLVDDFSFNLHRWEEAGFTGVKYYNGINGTHGTWKGYSINHEMPPEKMSVVVSAVADSIGA